MASTWILVAHDAGARLFTSQGRGKGLALIESIEHPEGRERDRDIDSDRPGRSFRRDSGDPRRASMGKSQGPHDRAVARFAKRLADRLEHARVTNELNGLVLVAPPRFLGLLRSSIDVPTSRMIIGSIHKDLATSTEAELAKHLREMIAV